MTTFFDVVTVTCFAGLVLAFFQFTNRETRTLMHFLLVAIVFAVANQLGNAGSAILAFILIVVGAGYTFMIVRHNQ